MNFSIRFTRPTVKSLIQRRKEAYTAGDLRLIRRVSALLELAQEKTVAQVSEAFAVARQTIYDWLKAFLQGGLDSLVYRQSPGRPRKLSKRQRNRLVELVKAGPLAAGYPTACWTSLLVQDLIGREFGVAYNRHYVCDLLHNLGFSFQKARFVSDHLDEQSRQEWLDQVWPQILELTQAKEAMILFGDEVSFAQWGSLFYTWAPVGEQPVVKTSGKRKGYKVFGLIDFFSGRFFYQGLAGRFNSERYQVFLQGVLDQTTQHLILIQDGARYHTSKATRSFFERHQDRLTVFQLPSYSPDYNPIEFLWKNIKRQSTHNQYFPEFEGLVSSVDGALAYFTDHPEEIKCLRGPYIESLAALAA